MMKKLFYLLFIFSAFSCAQHKEVVYSCSPIINQWAKDNLDSIRRMDRAAFNNLDRGYQIAAWNGFTSQQQSDCWKGKMQNLKTLKWTSEEQGQIDKLDAFLKDNSGFLFNGKRLTKRQDKKMKVFFAQWIKDCEDKCGWTKAFCFSIAGSVKDLDSKDGVAVKE